MTSPLVSVTPSQPGRIHVRDSESGELLVVELADMTFLTLSEELAEQLHLSLGNALEVRGLRIAIPADMVSQLKTLAGDLRWDDLADWAARLDAVLATPAGVEAANR